MIGIKNVIAIVCGGGPAPGINSVISGITNEATRHGWDVLGIYDGFSRLARGEKNYVRLEPKDISHIHMAGGCILKMSRFNPTKKESDLRTVVETLTELGVTHLVTIGGDDTAYSSAAVSEEARKMGRTINVVHVPKTIDNDLPLPEGVPTFGFETARAFATTEIENLMEDARTTNNRWYFTIAMGRTAGHLALGMGRSAGAAITIIPEEFPQKKIPLQQLVDIITGSIVKRYLTGKNYGVAVIAEGVIEKIAPEDFKKLGEVVTDEHGHIRYSELDFGEILKQAVLAEVKKIGIKVSIIDKEIGYELRCTAPIAYDIDYARSLGYSAVRFLMRGDSGALISIQNNEAVPMRFEDIKDPATGKTRVRKVNIKSVQYRIARGSMMRMEKEDLDDPGLANAYRMTPKEFKARYAYLFETGEEQPAPAAKDAGEKKA
ncbi:diphosphate--fructose-6-phosphate 1-phosphotransferase [Mitsuokella multacida]|jgi:6-phosphofructokinase|uniref:Pyrophosphate--fructose 6-phosphate 1-phosphotransferase n=2 Tax=Mitsuokella multacida TaxID=52226 RepID=A0A414NVK4_9FIRM|nr:diphosphate--fructose-6-phosphate 1-phosphotransferase [Mitsuokella multacida]EEX70068.1 Phosphofructokinase [Mitsuokella multacida DSM 20544]MDO5582828.1 diphosphate--fructose-6-phosphate 1-phosphotransferase [Mitsuokella multacida]RHF51004.1 6-phosphofructokinase [Mitsuokella multacida]